MHHIYYNTNVCSMVNNTFDNIIVVFFLNNNLTKTEVCKHTVFLFGTGLESVDNEYGI